MHEDKVQTYIYEFHQLQTMVDGWSDEALLGTFIDGLKPWLAKELKLKQPTRLQEAMKMVEILDQSGYHYPRLAKTSTMASTSHKDQPPFCITASSTPVAYNLSQPAQTIKKLSREELQDYIKKGLCFCCGVWWEKGHKCAIGQAHNI